MVNKPVYTTYVDSKKPKKNIVEKGPTADGRTDGWTNIYSLRRN